MNFKIITNSLKRARNEFLKNQRNGRHENM